MLQSWLGGYDPDKCTDLLTSLNYGIIIPSDLRAVLTDNVPFNHTSIDQHSTLVQAWLDKEISKGRVAGPFTDRPRDLHVSPLAAVPKKDPGKIRLIHNLSYPYACSVNSHIPRQFCAVQYELLDLCLDLIATVGPGCLMAKADLADAYRILKVSQYDYRFLGFTFQDKFYFDKVLPMGLSTSCAQFEQFSSAIQWILQSKLHVKLMSHILDDFMFFGPPDTPQCNLSLQAFTHLADSIGLPIKHEKTVLPSTSVELHGILINSITMTLSIPPDKLLKANELINSIYRCKSVLSAGYPCRSPVPPSPV